MKICARMNVLSYMWNGIKAIVRATKGFYISSINFFKKLRDVYKETKSLKAVFLYVVKTYRSQIFYTSILLIAITLLIPPLTYLYFARDLKDKDSIMNRSKTGLTLLDRENQPFFTFNQPKKFTYVPLVEIPDSIQQAVIATEDKNFYTNPGFSLRGIARAFLANLFAGRIVEGGSTITQELVKNALLSSSRNVLRKYQEIVLAYELNRRYSKKDILEMYLNSAYFGEGAFGVENAAQAYFGVHAKDLTLSQSSLLVGFLPAPSAFSPLSNNPEKALARRKIVLNEMVAEKYITQEHADQAVATEPVFNPVKQEEVNVLAPHFALFVKDFLFKKYGEEKVIRDGFRVTTTLNSKWQEYAERVVKNRVLSLSGNNATNGSSVAIDPKTGQILVMVGSYDWSDEKFGRTNMALAPRQPGSSFKPIIYSNAFERRLITPITILQDKPTTFQGNYKPKNYDRTYRGPVTVRRALANSLNIPAVEVMDQVGVESGLDTARKLGITTLKDPSNYGLSLVLGSGEVKLIELTNAYAVFADKGKYHESKAVLEIKNKYDQNVDTKTVNFFSLFNPFTIFNSFDTSNSKDVLSEDVSFLISSILSDNKARSEVFGGALTISRPAAVKTGTTEDYRDALTIGYTPSLVVGVWVGNNDNTPMDNVAGSLGAAPIWKSLMETFLQGTPIETFQKPFNVVDVPICLSQGASNASSSAYIEFFISGTQPDQSCVTPSPSTLPTNSPSPTKEEPTETPQPTETPEPTPTQLGPTTGSQPTPIKSGPTSLPLPTNPVTPTTPLTPAL